MKVVGIIPARYNSTRFPGKPLAMIKGKTMIRRVCEQAWKSKLNAVVVATDDMRIADEVMGFGGQYVLTDPNHRSGTDRCREALSLLDNPYDAIVNIQGDEPFIDPRQIDQVAELIRRDDTCLATLAKRITDPSRLDNPNVVKVVFDREGNALYFSRQPIDHYQHIGIYAYKADTLRTIAAMPMGRLERTERLEQLRWLENGLHIRVAVTEVQDNISIDTPQDLLNIPKELCQ